MNILKKVQLLESANQEDRRILDELSASKNIRKVDISAQLLAELDTISEDRKEFSNLKESAFNLSEYQHNGETWVYYPWLHSLVKVIPKKLYYQVLFSRNYPLISAETFSKIRNKTIGIVGLSVGRSVLASMLQLGMGSNFKLADPDLLELSNCNRISSSILDLGKNKSHLAYCKALEINPFLNIEVFDTGVHRKNFEHFFLGNKKLDIVVDECDNLLLKLFLRLGARSLDIPLLMVTDNGFNVDVELQRPGAGDPKKQLPKLDFDQVCYAYKATEQPYLTVEDEHALIKEIIGESNISEEIATMFSLREAGKITSFPQLGPTAAAAGALGSFALLQYHRDTISSQDSFSLRLIDIFTGD